MAVFISSIVLDKLEHKVYHVIFDFFQSTSPFFNQSLILCTDFDSEG